MKKVDFLTRIPKALTQTDIKGIKYTPAIKSAEDTFKRNCELRYKIDQENFEIFGEIPDDYVNISKTWQEARPQSKGRFGKTIPAKEAHWEETRTLKPAYYIDHLFSHGKGQGKNAIKLVVTESLNNPQTQGRVTLHADIIDGKTSPAGFYYKMGFRSTNKANNQELEKWLAMGGKRENAPMLGGIMYLPKENILHCLNY